MPKMLVLILTGLLLPVFPALAQSAPAEVTRVIDGDTFEVKKRNSHTERVRALGIRD